MKLQLISEQFATVPFAAKSGLAKLFKNIGRSPFAKTWENTLALKKLFELTDLEIDALFNARVLQKVTTGIQLNYNMALQLARMNPMQQRQFGF